MSKADYVLGIIVGEGCFSVGIEYSDSYKYNVSTRWLFQVHMKDKEALKSVKEAIGLEQEIKHRPRDGSRSGIYELYCRNSNQIDKVIDWVDTHRTVEFTRSNKSYAFDKWSKLWAERDKLMKSKSGTIELVKRAYSINNRTDTGKDIDEIVAHIQEA